MDKELFKDHADYWQIADNIRDIYMSEGTITTLLDFERVLDEIDVYAFKNWEIGELVAGPEISKYRVSCTFMWPEKLMPDPRGARRLLPFDCEINFKKQMIKIPIKITNPSDYQPGGHAAKIMEKLLVSMAGSSPPCRSKAPPTARTSLLLAELPSCKRRATTPATTTATA